MLGNANRGALPGYGHLRRRDRGGAQCPRDLLWQRALGDSVHSLADREADLLAGTDVVGVVAPEQFRSDSRTI